MCLSNTERGMVAIGHLFGALQRVYAESSSVRISPCNLFAVSHLFLSQVLLSEGYKCAAWPSAKDCTSAVYSNVSWWQKYHSFRISNLVSGFPLVIF